MASNNSDQEQPENQNLETPNQAQTTSPDEQSLKMVSAVGYLGILFLVPMLAYPKEKFAMFHANQGLILFILAVGVNILMPVLGAVTFGLGFLLYPLVWLALLAFFVIGIVNAFNGHMKRLPLIGGFDIIKYQGDK